MISFSSKESLCGIVMNHDTERITRRSPTQKYLVFDCGHMFCYDCIKSMIRVRYRKCPLCRKRFDSVKANEKVMVKGLIE